MLALFAGASAITWLYGFHWTPDRALLVFLPAAIILRRTRRYAKDFLPFAALLFLYTEFRGLAHVIRPHPFYAPQIEADRFLFGGYLPPEVLQDWLWTGTKQWYDVAIGHLLKIHFVVPPVLAFALWLRRRALFYRFAATMIALSFAGAITFAVYPAAPPWAATNKGLIEAPLIPPVGPPSFTHQTYNSFPERYPVSGTPTSGKRFSLARLIPGNPYAAIPSLHAGYAFLVFIFVLTLAWKRRGWRRWSLIGVVGLYPLAQSFAVIYTGNHYVVDIFIGFAFATAALLLVKREWRRRGLPE